MSEAASSAARPPSRSRLEFVDLARGFALLAMFVFHFAYDLADFGLTDVDVPNEPGWRLFARLIAGSFLTLVGVSLVLATRKGLNRRAFLKRLAMVAGAAAVVTIATFFAMRSSFIFFGILHHVALASVLALPFLRLPVLVVAASAIIAFALPRFVAYPLLDEPWLAWLGFSRAPLVSADFVPVFPWFGCVLGGIVLARLALPWIEGSALAGWRAKALPARLVVWGGRHSLLVYLVHQPVFIGLLMLALQIMPMRPVADEQPFMQACQRSCAQGGFDRNECEPLCACTVDSLKRESLWPKVRDNSLSETERTRMTELAQACRPPSKPR
ncbi:MAG TPA: heparan-alpha-glucosaminide N-acetyltransferase [Bosea sp. (in: a-proteobacteria)]|uniref:heparan-alpha-glucosaminide N-acetyltransferase n=1 Tax=Bosea sp. (in: a-proteobacteria) TaxID=1871050 RepID=UPI002E151E35|nr:heparan-alpha-glucosaminide N-acetyltransferase [Bosea sp. (in: a-proteobacteria)]